jgi:hypothetical protein
VGGQRAARIECDGKVKFSGPALAHEVAGRSKPPRSAYHCRICGAWHVAGGNEYQKGVNKRKRAAANLVRPEMG